MVFERSHRLRVLVSFSQNVVLLTSARARTHTRTHAHTHTHTKRHFFRQETHLGPSIVTKRHYHFCFPWPRSRIMALWLYGQSVTGKIFTQTQLDRPKLENESVRSRVKSLLFEPETLHW